MIKYLLLLFLLVSCSELLLFLLVSCSESKIRQDFIEKNHSQINIMQYTKDERTGLCFAIWRDYNWAGLATVPCEKVEKFLDK